MIITLPNVLQPILLTACQKALMAAHWTDGRVTAGHLAANAKQNRQLPLDAPLAREIGQHILDALSKHPVFLSAALPARILPPRFNRYEGAGTYGNHIDNAIFSAPGSPERVRSDISATLFFSEPSAYEGGELVIQDTFGTHEVKLPAGHMVIYPGSSLHHVRPVHKGVRLASFFWVQSLVRHDHQRALLWELDQSIQGLAATQAHSAADHSDTTQQTLTRLSGVYHNLLREWATP